MLNFYGKSFTSRLLVGSALYPSPAIMQGAIRASGAEIVTVSLRREAAGGKTGDAFWSLIRELDVTLLPNTARCRSVPDAVTTANLARAPPFGASARTRLRRRPVEHRDGQGRRPRRDGKAVSLRRRGRTHGL